MATLVLCQGGWYGACDPAGWGAAGPGGAGFDPSDDAQAGTTPAYVFVTNFTNQSDGTITYQLTPSDAVGDYPQIFADTANLDGTLRAAYLPGLYGDTLYYDDIIDANTLVGTFATVEDNSALLDTTAVYDGFDNVDLDVTRVAFDAVPGQSQNQKAVGGAIEDVYPTLLAAYAGPPPADPNDFASSDPFAFLVANMFSMDASQLGSFYDQLGGSEYAQYLQAVLWSTAQLNRTITDRMECNAPMAEPDANAADGAAPAMDHGMQGCLIPNRVNAWIRAGGTWNTQDGDRNASGYKEDVLTVDGGVDYAVSNALFVGFAAGYYNSSMDFDRFNNKIDYNGFQVAGYGGFDNGMWYGRGILSYGNYDANSHRHITIDNTLDPSGNPDSDVLTFYGEGGKRFDVSNQAVVTPYVGLQVSHANIDGFTEDDPHDVGAALQVHDADGSSVATVLGVRFEGNWMTAGVGIRPEVSAAWMHEFGDNTQSVDMTFDAAPSGADFTVISAETARDSALVGAGVTFGLGEHFDFKVDYDGRFNSDYTSHSVSGRFTAKY